MIHYLEGAPEATEAGEAVETSPAETRAPAAPAAAVTSDTITTGRAAFAAPAYVPYGIAPRAATSALAAQFGSQYALIRAALPNALQPQLDAQVTAAAGSLFGGDAAADEGRPVFAESDLAAIVRSSMSDPDGAFVSLLVARLARTIARTGAAPVVRSLRLADDRVAFATPSATPGQWSDSRVRRGDGNRAERERDRRRSDRNDPDESDEPPAAAAGERPVSITDTVYFGGTPVASLHPPLRAL